VLVAVAAGLLFALGAGMLGVSLAAQYRFIVHVKHQPVASAVEAAGLDLGMVIFSLLALGLARGGQPARVERTLVVICAVGSAVMNWAAANQASPRSVLAYCMPPVFLAVVADRVIAVVRRHVLGPAARSPWQAAARPVLYGARLVLAPPSTAAGLRRWLLHVTPLPPTMGSAPVPKPGTAGAAEVPARAALAARPVAMTRGRNAGPRRQSKTSRFLDLVSERHGPLACFPLGDVSPTCAALAPEVGLDCGAARTALRRAVLEARDGGAQ
jgi:hypothetical protein